MLPDPRDVLLKSQVANLAATNDTYDGVSG
jgi:hypothetical protein